MVAPSINVELTGLPNPGLTGSKDLVHDVTVLALNGLVALLDWMDGDGSIGIAVFFLILVLSVITFFIVRCFLRLRGCSSVHFVYEGAQIE